MDSFKGPPEDPWPVFFLSLLHRLHLLFASPFFFLWLHSFGVFFYPSCARVPVLSHRSGDCCFAVFFAVVSRWIFRRRPIVRPSFTVTLAAIDFDNAHNHDDRDGRCRPEKGKQRARHGFPTTTQPPHGWQERTRVARKTTSTTHKTLRRADNCREIATSMNPMTAGISR